MEPQNSKGEISIPSSMVIQSVPEKTPTQQLMDFAFPDLSRYSTDAISMTNSAILSPRNDTVDEINEELIGKFPGEQHEYLSIDQTVNKAHQGLYIDFMHSVAPLGLPPHRLILKENCPVILLRNINPSKGLCNGTRLICRRFEKHTIIAEIAVGEKKTDLVFIPRIPLKPSDPKLYPVEFTRHQFPIRLCFGMTINKAQGQTLDTVGIILTQPVFSHGQLYVALSRATTATKIKILLDTSINEFSYSSHTKNIVYHEILDEAQSNKQETSADTSLVRFSINNNNS